MKHASVTTTFACVLTIFSAFAGSVPSQPAWDAVAFLPDSDILTGGFPALTEIAVLLKSDAGYRATLLAVREGPTATARAEAVKRFLLARGVPKDRVSVVTAPRPGALSKTGVQIAFQRQTPRRPQAPETIGVRKTVVEEVDQKLPGPDAPRKPDCVTCPENAELLANVKLILTELKQIREENVALQLKVEKLEALLINPPGKPATETAANRGDLVINEVRNLSVTSAGTVTAVAPPDTTINVNNPQKLKITGGGESQRRFALLGLSAGPTTGGRLSLSGRGRFFSPFGEGGAAALQAQGEYMHNGSLDEGQLDAGIVDRWRNWQAGLFSSFKYLNFGGYQNGGGLVQASFTLDAVLPRGRIGFFGTQGIKSTAVLNRAQLGPNSFLETYARVVNQIGASGQLGLWSTSYLEGNIGYLKLHGQTDRPGGTVRFVHPLRGPFALTVEGGWNETYVGSQNSGRVVFGFELGNFVLPRMYGQNRRAIPADVPRIRFETLTRRIGNSPPVADAGPDQIGIKPGTVTLNGSASYDPDGDIITYAWQQIAGSPVAISGANTAVATFTAGDSQSYGFRLTVKDPAGLQSIARTTVTTTKTCSVNIERFSATPESIVAGESSLLQWKTDAESVTIDPAPPSGASQPAQGSVQVSPVADTTYTLTARSGACTDRAQAVVRVQTADPLIIRFVATPERIAPGASSQLSWTTQGATTVTISPGPGTVATSGSTTVSPPETTTYTLTASRDAKQVSASVRVVVAAPLPRIVRFSGTPTELNPGESATLCWDVANAKTLSLAPGDFGALKLPDSCVTVTPPETRKYTLTATNETGSASAEVVITVRPLVKILTFTATPQVVTADRPQATLAWTTSNATRVVITGNGAPAGDLPANGNATVTVKADTIFTLIAYGDKSEVSAVVLVRIANCPSPVAEAGPNQQVLLPVVSLNGSASRDPSGGALTFHWDNLSPEVALFSQPDSATTTVTLRGHYGQYTFRLTVTNQCGQSATSTAVVNWIDP